MRGLMNRVSIVCAVAAALVAVPLAVADANFTDPKGDAAGAPDIVGMVVANDARNRVAFEIELGDKQKLTADQEVYVWVDSDNKSETGQNSWDYVAWVSDDDFGLDRWDGTKWVEAPATTVKVYSIAGMILYGVDRAELGNTAAFSLYAEGAKYSGDQQVASDVAPDGDAVWNYASVTKTFGLTATAITARPKPPVAGKKFVAEFVARRTDSIELLEGAKTTCKVTIGLKPVVARVTGALGFAECTVAKVPLTAKGKLLKVTMTTAAGGKSVTKTYSARVR
jgi:hypothetical protein